MGRFYNTAQSQFVDGVFKPDLQLAMKALLNEQQQYDTQKAVLEEFMNLKFNHLNSEEENENARIAKEYYMQNADDIAKAMMADKQNYHKYMDRIKGLRRDLISDFEDGPIGKMVNNYNQEQAWKKENAGILKENPALYNALFSEARKNWGGNSVTGGVWQQENGLKAFDQQAIENNIQKFEADIKKNSRQTANGTWIYDDGYEVKELTEQDIRNYAVNKVLSDPSAIAYFKQSDRLGLSNYLNPDGSLNENGTLSNWLDAIRSYAYRKEDSWHKMQANPYGLQRDKYGLEFENFKKKKEYEEQKKNSLSIYSAISRGFTGTPEKYKAEVEEMWNALKAGKELTPRQKELKDALYNETVDNMADHLKNSSDEKAKQAIEKKLLSYGYTLDEFYDNLNNEFDLKGADKERFNRLKEVFKKSFEEHYRNGEEEAERLAASAKFERGGYDEKGRLKHFAIIDNKKYEVKRDPVNLSEYINYNGKKMRISSTVNDHSLKEDIRRTFKNGIVKDIYDKSFDTYTEGVSNQEISAKYFHKALSKDNENDKKLISAVNDNLKSAIQTALETLPRDKYGNIIFTEGKLGETSENWFPDKDFQMLVQHIDNIQKITGKPVNLLDDRFKFLYEVGSKGQRFIVEDSMVGDKDGAVSSGKNKFSLEVPLNTNYDDLERENLKNVANTPFGSEILRQSPQRNDVANSLADNYSQNQRSRKERGGTNYTQTLNTINPYLKMDVKFDKNKKGHVDLYLEKPDGSKTPLTDRSMNLNIDSAADIADIYKALFDSVYLNEKTNLF